MNDKNLALMDSIMMDAIVQSDEWQKIQLNDPRITAANDRLEAALEQARALIDLYAELSDAHSAVISALGDSGILFGIHVADAIRDVASRPADLSRRIMERMEGRA